MMMINLLPLPVLMIAVFLGTATAKAGWELVFDTTITQPQSPGLTSESKGRGKLVTAASQPDIEQPDCQHIVRQGDSLSGIAKLRLGDASLWRELASANNLSPDGRINQGTIIDLPCHEDWSSRVYRDIDPPVETRDLATAIRETREAEAEIVSGTGEHSESSNPQDNNSMTTVSESIKLNQYGEDKTPLGQNNSPEPPVVVRELSEASEEYNSANNNQETDGDTVWQARGGSLLDDIIAEWTLKSGYRLIIEDRWSWKLDYDYEYAGDMKAAITDLMSGWSHTLPAPVVTFYSNDVVVLSVK